MPRVDLDRAALADNWRLLAGLAPGARTGAAVKADGYGLGAEEVSRVLYKAGCRDFFVAWASEGAALRRTLTELDARIVVLQGLDRHGAALCREAGLVPVLSTLSDIALWLDAGGVDQPLPAFLQLETGMNRLGLGSVDAAAAAALVKSRRLKIDCVMSHLASADETSDQSAKQRSAFNRLAALFPGIPRSLANSAAIRLGSDFHYELTRPGIALYGGGDPGGHVGLKPVATLSAAVLQVRLVAHGETAGYGGAAKLGRNTLIATVGLGYADGLPRTASNGTASGGTTFVDGRQQPSAAIGGQLVPILGRISMDMTLLDVTDFSGRIEPGDRAEFFGSNLLIDRAAASAGTIAYEMLTGIGPRVERVWI